MPRPDAKNIPTPPDQELLALLAGIPEDDQDSPDRSRQIRLKCKGRVWSMTSLGIYNRGYPNRGPRQNNTLMRLCFGENIGSVDLEAQKLSEEQKVFYFFYDLETGVRSGGSSYSVMNADLVPQLTKDLLREQDLPERIDAMATARAFIAQVKNPDPAIKFGVPKLILPDGAVFQPKPKSE